MKLRPYQRVGIHLIKKFDGRVLLADDQGLGKTVQVLEWLRRNPKKRPVIIVCPASVKYVWEEQARDHCNLRTVVCYGQKPPKKKTTFGLKTNNILIINYDILIDWCRYLRDLCPQVVVFDEVHKLKNRGTLRTRAARLLCSPIRKTKLCNIRILDGGKNIKKETWVSFEDENDREIEGFVTNISNKTITIKTQIPHLMGLSGTPLINRPKELWSTLNLIWPLHFPAYLPFAWDFCDPSFEYGRWTYNGASNLKKLNRILTRVGMIRRLKKDVAKDLPKKQVIVVPVDIDNRKEYNEAKNDFINWLSRKDAAKAERASRAKKITQMNYLRQIASVGKLKSVKEWIDNFFEESDNKLVLGCWHQKVINNLYKKYSKTSVVFTGKTPSNKRQYAIMEFCNNPKRRLFIGQIQAAGTGVDGLQKVSHTTGIVELPWEPGTLSQFFDRIHRIGQTKNVFIYIFVAKDTLEEKLCEIIQTKQKTLTKILDGKKMGKDTSLDIYKLMEKELLK